MTCVSCGGRVVLMKCLSCGAVGGAYHTGGYKMAKPKMDKKDYVYCPKCTIIVPKIKLVKPEAFFADETEGEVFCPFCNGKVEDLE